MNKKEREKRNIKILELAREGNTLASIARRFGIGKPQVHRIVSMHGVHPLSVRQELLQELRDNKLKEKYGMTAEEMSKVPKKLRRKINKLISQAKIRSQRRGIEFTIKLSDVLSDYTGTCPVLGVKYEDKGDYVMSIDRKDSSLGYTPDNISVMSWRANRIKYNSTLEELELLCKYLRELSSE